MLRGQDIVLAIKLAQDPPPRRQAELATALRWPGQYAVAKSLQRLRVSGLLAPRSMEVRTAMLMELLVHGLRYFFPVGHGRETLGVPTGLSAPGVKELIPIPASGVDVWPHPGGSLRGMTVTPLHASVPAAALADRRLHLALALVDLLRMGRARERKLAEERLEQLLGGDSLAP